MLNLEEAIEHCEEIAEEKEKQAIWLYSKESNPNYENCIECAKEHRQLAEWLRELEWRRNAMVEIHEAMLMPASMAERISKEVNVDDIR